MNLLVFLAVANAFIWGMVLGIQLAQWKGMK